jgi:TolB-like protein/class 3 adenylate cyclase/Flp pilus assembly protein TadD
MQGHRQLAAILFTDIVGYTAIMHRNEEEAVTVIKRHNAVMEAEVARHGGELLNFYGDGCLCIFPSVSEGLACALEVQHALRAPPVVPLRMALHIGEVFFERDKVLGDGVNIASRILSLAQGQTVLLSAEARDKIRNQPQYKVVSLGSFGFKNVEEPIEVFALCNEGLRVPERRSLEGKLSHPSPKTAAARHKWIGAGIILVILLALLLLNPLNEKPPPAGREKSVAVLPFTNTSNDPGQDYFSDGITEEIITQLNKVSDLRVIARSTTMRYKNQDKSTKQIARELGVASILEGSVRKAGNDIRITAQLTDADSQEQLWAENYDLRQPGDVFAVQSAVAQQIALELDVRLSDEEKVSLEKRPTTNPQAYDLLLKARYAYSHSDDFYAAEKFLLKAIQLDPSFSLAYSYLANLYVLSASWSGYLEPEVSAQKATEVLRRKPQKDTLYIDFNTLASIEFLFHKNYPRAEYYYQRSISTYPKEELTFNMYALLLTILGRIEEALVQLDKAKALSPVNSFEAIQRAEAYYAARRYNEAVQLYENAIQVFPDIINLYDGLGRVYVQQRRYADAIRILLQAMAVRPIRQPSSVAYLALAYHHSNDTRKAAELVEELAKRARRGEKGTNVFLALYFSARNQKPQAYHYLDEAFATGDVDLVWLKQEPSFDPLRSDPRFAPYLKKAGF